MKNTIRHFITNGFWLMIFAAFIYSLTNVLFKFLSSSSFPATQIGFIRFLVGGLIVWPILSSKGISLRGNQSILLVLRGLTGTFSFFCLLKSIAMIPLANAIVLLYTFPLFAVLFSLLLFRIGIEKGELILIGVGLVGIYILTDPHLYSFNIGYLYGLLSGCSGGLVVVLIHKARQSNGPLIIYFYFCLMGGILSFPFFIQNFKVPNVQQGILLFLLALMLLIGHVIMNQGFKFCKASEGSLILMSEIVFTGIASFMIFKDPVTSNFLAGAFLVIGSGVGLNLMSRKSRHAPAFSETDIGK